MITIGSKIRIPISALTNAELRELKKELTTPNPEYVTRLRMGKGVWKVPKTLEWFQHAIGHPHGQEIQIPRGLATRASIDKLDKIDERSLGFRCVWPAGPTRLRNYQKTAAAALVSAEQGIIVAGCGSGKTLIACEALRLAGVDAVILVHTLDLAAQWCRVLEAELGIVPRVLGGTKRKGGSGSITVATVQTLQRKSTVDLAEILEAGALIVDEAHHCPASTFDTIVQASPSRYRWALTATPKRADGLSAVLGFLFGDVVATVEADTLLAAGALIRPTYRQIRTAFEHEWKSGDDLHPVLELLAADEPRRALLVDLIRQSDRPTLVLVGRVQHAQDLAATLGAGSELLVGEIGARARDAAFARMRSGESRILISTTIADEGLDLPLLERLILAWPTRSESRTVQRIGRVMRASPGKTSAEVIDLVDAGCPALAAQASQRRRAALRVTTFARA